MRGNKCSITCIFFHPDYTVGFGIKPKSAFARGLIGYAALPPVGNRTPPRRQLIQLVADDI